MLRTSIALLFALVTTFALAAAPQPPGIDGHSWLLADLSSNQILASDKADVRFEPASLTKLMTAYLVFRALHEKQISLEQTIQVSARAWKAPGSRMFIQPGMPVTVGELIQGMEVDSGNDACTALAETVAGSEDVFVQMMNREAARLGMKNTHYANVTGLPDPQHYSTAHDIYLLTAALIRDFPAEYARYYSQKEYTYNRITQRNRNRLLWLDPHVDGVKTGHTEAAGYCLVASSKHGERRLLSVLLGAPSEQARASESLKLLNWGYQFYDSVKLYDRGQTVKQIQVWKGAEPTVNAGFDGALMLAVPKGDSDKLSAQLVSQRPLVAPVAQGQRVGVLRVTLQGSLLGEYPLVALQPVATAGIFGRAWDTLRLWMK
ncbi:MAG TPA: D-alanyl-D-alanine carboxypeptidase family protein [Burkholderiales bacterium]|nr:D-alanyl-D-alanine carboxypeptidase family protein [Burkholderiales bacterium]